MIGSGSFCTVEGVKVSVSFFPPYEAGRAMASLPGGGRKKDRKIRSKILRRWCRKKEVQKNEKFA